MQSFSWGGVLFVLLCTPLVPDAAPDPPPASSLPATRSRYSDDEKASALALVAEVGVPDAARETGIPARTLFHWHAGRGVHPAALHTAAGTALARADAYEAGESRGLRLMDRLYDHAEEALDAADEAGERLPLPAVLEMAERLMRITATATDRARLLRGESTQIVETRATLLSLMLRPQAATDGEDQD